MPLISGIRKRSIRFIRNKYKSEFEIQYEQIKRVKPIGFTRLID